MSYESWLKRTKCAIYSAVGSLSSNLIVLPIESCILKTINTSYNCLTHILYFCNRYEYVWHKYVIKFLHLQYCIYCTGIVHYVQIFLLAVINWLRYIRVVKETLICTQRYSILQYSLNQSRIPVPVLHNTCFLFGKNLDGAFSINTQNQ